MFDAMGGTPQAFTLTLYTDAFQIRGTIETRQRRITDVLNRGEDPFVVLADVTFEEFGTRASPIRAEFAQINLASVLFVVSDEPVEPFPELRTPKMAEPAIISVPPFKVTGRIHLMPERNLRAALEELHGQFVPVTDAVFWSDSLNEARTSAMMVAVNHSRSQILAPHREVDPWAGLDGSQATGRQAAGGGAAGGGAEGGGVAPPAEARPEPTGWE